MKRIVVKTTWGATEGLLGHFLSFNHSSYVLAERALHEKYSVICSPPEPLRKKLGSWDFCSFRNGTVFNFSKQRTV